MGTRWDSSQLYFSWVYAYCPVSPYLLYSLILTKGLFHRTKKILDDNPDLKNQWTSLIPQGKMGQPEDLMGAVTFLSSDASGYITGTLSILYALHFHQLTPQKARTCGSMVGTP